jgi:hypothetical protein
MTSESTFYKIESILFHDRVIAQSISHLTVPTASNPKPNLNPSKNPTQTNTKKVLVPFIQNSVDKESKYLQYRHWNHFSDEPEQKIKDQTDSDSNYVQYRHWNHFSDE